MGSGGHSATSEPAIEVWICDEHPIFRRGLMASLAGSEFGLAGDSASLQSATIDTVDVLVFGASQAALQQLDSSRHLPRLIAIANRHDRDVLREAVDRGASAVLDRAEMTPDNLLSAIRVVHAGATLLPQGVLPELLAASPDGGHPPGGLTDRELAVLRMLAEGDDTRDIAGSLAYSERTVKNVVHDLLMKMNCRNRTHAVAQATRQGVI